MTASAPANVKPRAGEHTLGKWMRDTQTGAIVIEAESGRDIAVCSGKRPRSTDNARRIVACVNACEGVENAELEDLAALKCAIPGVAGVAQMAILNDTLEAANKELVEALEGMLALFDDEGNFREEFQDQASVADEKARAVLNKIK